MTTSLTWQQTWKFWCKALSALVRAERPNLSPRQIANLRQVYIASLLETLCRPADIMRIFNFTAVFVMDALNHTKFARRKGDESDKRNILTLPIVKDSIFLCDISAGLAVASEIL